MFEVAIGLTKGLRSRRFTNSLYLQTLTKTPWNRSSPLLVFLAVDGGRASQSVIFVACKRHRSTVHEAFIDNLRSIVEFSRVRALNNYAEEMEYKSKKKQTKPKDTVIDKENNCTYQLPSISLRYETDVYVVVFMTSLYIV